jgi:hypothetical protein
MEGARWNSKSAVDAGVKVTRNTGDPVPLHEGETGSFPGVEEDVVDATTLRDREGLVNDHAEAKHPPVKGARCPHVMGGETDMVDRHGLAEMNYGFGTQEGVI